MAEKRGQRPGHGHPKCIPADPCAKLFSGSFPEWRNWQTQQTQNLPGITPRVGSTPSSGTKILKQLLDYLRRRGGRLESRFYTSFTLLEIAVQLVERLDEMIWREVRAKSAGLPPVCRAAGFFSSAAPAFSERSCTVEDLTVVLSRKDFISAADIDAVLLLIRASAARAAINLSEVAVISVANADGVQCVRRVWATG